MSCIGYLFTCLGLEVLLACGSNETALAQQTVQRMSKMSDVRAFKNNELGTARKVISDKVSAGKKLVVMVDESHYGALKGNRLTTKIGTSLDSLSHIISVSATPHLYKGAEFKLQKFYKSPKSYKGVNFRLENNQIFDNSKVSHTFKKGKLNSRFIEFLGRCRGIFHNEGANVIWVRTSTEIKKNHEKFEDAIRELNGFENVLVERFDSKNREASPERIFKKYSRLNIPLIVLVDGYGRMGNTGFGKKGTVGVWEKTSNKEHFDTHLQALPGRVCGYDVSDKVIVGCDSEVIQAYADFVASGDFSRYIREIGSVVNSREKHSKPEHVRRGVFSDDWTQNFIDWPSPVTEKQKRFWERIKNPRKGGSVIEEFKEAYQELYQEIVTDLTKRTGKQWVTNERDRKKDYMTIGAYSIGGSSFKSRSNVKGITNGELINEAIRTGNTPPTAGNLSEKYTIAGSSYNSTIHNKSTRLGEKIAAAIESGNAPKTGATLTERDDKGKGRNRDAVLYFDPDNMIISGEYAERWEEKKKEKLKDTVPTEKAKGAFVGEITKGENNGTI